ncbi:dTDP-4-amino-4,6-dideoxygalactose transaminase [Lacibacter luteus]|uniref:dTDP-4-amino-4,6-dideoxygalactose transaminase n=1 Tax=Lacibacter luteus TaxID=2508719 RepID=A0A4Q1CD79_9BACT|nr:dTDP-4-amino-4,6-dideoxygalactose transaminase [Lacibacter luteus]RXK57436.1 dTDP-4-amino-4,6-dideoxygalactose transaminase [Lacibacter luteus]
MILLSKPAVELNDGVLLQDAVLQMQQGQFHRSVTECENYLQQQYNTTAFLTPSCTAALEIAALTLQLKPGDEVIVPSYTFVGTVTPFTKLGVTIRFADSTATHPNVDVESIKQKLSEKTKAIVVVHYAGVACAMNELLSLAADAGVPVLEDAAHCIGAKYNNQYLGTIGGLGAISFDSQKNISCLQGGALFVNNHNYLPIAETVRYNGTNKAAFLRKETTSFEWVGNGGNYEISNISAALLVQQLKRTQEINRQRLNMWQHYFTALEPLQANGFIALPAVPSYAQHNAHVFYVLLPDANKRNSFIAFMQSKGIQVLFHYLALHRSPYMQAQQVNDHLPYAGQFEERLVRLPLHTQLSKEEQQKVINSVYSFFEQ